MKTESKGNCGHPSHPIPCPYSHTESKHTPGYYSLAEIRNGTGFEKGARFVQVRPDEAPLLEECKVLFKALFERLTDNDMVRAGSFSMTQDILDILAKLEKE